MIIMNLRKTIGIIACAVAVAAVSPCAHAQDYVQEPVTVSKEKVKVGGRLCYSHVVLERQTLYSISKAYGVSIEDIYAFNPSVRTTGLKKNAILLIPVADARQQNAQKDTKDTRAAKTGAAGAAAKPETAAKAETAVKPETTATEAKPEVEATARKEVGDAAAEQKIHVVRWYETIETIAEKYGVGVNAIMKANNLTGKELKSRQKLVIPAAGPDEEPVQAIRGEVSGSTAEAEETAHEDVHDVSGTEEIVNVVSGQNDVVGSGYCGEVRFALAMPFMSGSEKPSSSSMDFYCGALLAARELGIDGLEVKIDVFDTGKGFPTAQELSGDDFIIGPISPEDIRKMHAAAGGKPIISPLDPKAGALTAEIPELIQVPTPHELQYADLVQWIAEETKDKDRTILISEKGGKESEAMKSFSEILELSGIQYRQVRYSILEGRDILETLMDVTASGEEVTNRFIIASESEAFVNDAFRNIGLLSREGRKVAVFCHSKVRGYDIEVESLHNNDLHISLAYYIDYSAPETIRFVKEYRALFNTEPTQFSFQGHDIAKYFCRMKSMYGKDWLRHIGQHRETLLQTTFDFRDGSRMNEGVRRIEYEPDYRIGTR